MVDVITRASKGAALTWAEVDANFTALAASSPDGLGTAAYVDTGTTSGTLPLLTTGNKLAAAAMGQGNSALVALSGSNVDFTGIIPSTARRVTLMFNGLSTNGTTVPLVQLGDAGGIETTGYNGSVSIGGAGANLSTGISMSTSWAATAVLTGSITFLLMDATTNLWNFTGIGGRVDTAQNHVWGGSKALSEVLTQMRITAGANTFDAGTASILWE